VTSWILQHKCTSYLIIFPKNYLSHEELDILNRIVTIYLEFAELQALNRAPMYMTDWITKLDDFLTISDRELLTHAGLVSHQQALEKAHARAVQCYEQILGFSFSNTILFLKSVDCEKYASFCEQKTEYLGLKKQH